MFRSALRPAQPAPAESRAPARGTGPSLERWLGLAASALPFALALSRAATSGQWRGDLAAVRDGGLVSLGFGGGLSTLVTQLLGLLPLGPGAFKASLGACLGLLVAARLLFAITAEALAGTGISRGLAALLAAIAAATAALSPTWQTEATVGGGAMLAVAAALATARLAQRAARVKRRAVLPARELAWLGVAAGATLAESPPAFLGALAISAAIFAASRPLVQPPPRALRLAGLSFASALGLLSAPLLLRPLAPRGLADLGRALSASSLAAVDVAGQRTTSLEAYLAEVGAASLAVAALGAAAALARRSSRPVGIALLLLVLLDALLPARLAGIVSADPLSSLRSLALGALSALAAGGIALVLGLLRTSRLPLARPARVLLVAFHASLASLASEQAGGEADRSARFGPEEFTDLALGDLEPGAALVVRSPEIALRLWAARLGRGERPDVLVVPEPLLGRGRVALALSATDKAVDPLLRDHALLGGPTEFSLSALADARPLFVEHHAGLDARVERHLSVSGAWLAYAPEPLGSSDRRAAAEKASVSLERAMAEAMRPGRVDRATARVLAASRRAHARVLGRVGETELATRALESYARLLPSLAPEGAVIAVSSDSKAEKPGEEDAEEPTERGKAARRLETRRAR